MAVPTAAHFTLSGWLVTLGIFALFFITYGPLYNYSLLFVSLREEFHSSAAVTGWVGSLANGLPCFFSLLAGRLVTRFGYRAVFTLALTVYSLGFLATSFVPSIYWAFPTLGVLSAVGTGLLFHSGIRLLFEWFPRKNTARAGALALLGTSAGMLTFAPLMSSFIALYGWRNALRIVSGVAFVIGIAATSLLGRPQPRDPPPGKEEVEETATTSSPANATPSRADRGTDAFEEEIDRATAGGEANFTARPTERQEDNIKSAGDSGAKTMGLRDVIGRLDVWLFCCAVATGMTGWTFVIINFASFMKTLGFSVDQTSLVFILLSLAEIVGKVLTALLGDHLPFLMANAVAAASVIGAITSVFMTSAKSLTEMIVISLVYGIVRGVFFCITLSASYELFNECGGDIATSIAFISWSVGIFIAAPLTGGLFDISGNYTLSLCVLGALFALSSLCIAAITVGRTCALRVRRAKPGRTDTTDCHAAAGTLQLSSQAAGTENQAYDADDKE